MAYNPDHADPEEPTGLYADPRVQEDEPRSGRLLHLAGALLVMGVFAGGLWIAYNQGLRHGGASVDSGEVPLVRADTSPFKVKPANPGGMQIPDRDMLIYGEQQPQVEHLLPPAEQPMARPTPPSPPPPPKEETNSTPSSSAAPPEQATASPTPQPLSAPPQQTVASATPALPVTPPGKIGNSAPALSPSGLQEPLPQVANTAITQSAVKPHANSETASPAPSAQSSPATDLIGQKIEQLEAAAAANRVKQTDAKRGGGLRLQLGALHSESEARSAWERLKRNNTDLLGNLTGATVRADLGKQTYYRIETGPIGDPATATRVCRELRQRHLACVVVR